MTDRSILFDCPIRALVRARGSNKSAEFVEIQPRPVYGEEVAMPPKPGGIGVQFDTLQS